MNTIYTTILGHLRTTSEVDTLLQKIDELLANMYKVDQKNLSTIFAGHIRSEIAESIEATLTQQNLRWSNPNEVKEFFTSLKKLIQTTTVLNLTIAFAPSDETISLFAAKTKEYFGMTTLLEIKIQESIIGGSIIVYNGKYLDYTLERRLKDSFKNHSKEIALVYTPDEKAPLVTTTTHTGVK